jgi:DNA modification methylase
MWYRGDPDCDHTWDEDTRPTTPGGLAVNKARVGATRRGIQREMITDAICVHCGAWRGALGTERKVDDYISHCSRVTSEIMRVLKPDGVAFWNVGESYDPERPKSIAAVPERMTIAMIEQGWIVRNSLVWHKPLPIPVTSGDRFYSAHEIVIVATKRRRYKWREQPSMRHDVWTIGHPRIKGGNSATFPPELPLRCILHSTDPGDLVLDPFAGSGTALAIAEQLDRQYLGFDISRGFVEGFDVRRRHVRDWYYRAKL